MTSIKRGTAHRLGLRQPAPIGWPAMKEWVDQQIYRMVAESFTLFRPVNLLPLPPFGSHARAGCDLLPIDNWGQA